MNSSMVGLPLVLLPSHFAMNKVIYIFIQIYTQYSNNIVYTLYIIYVYEVIL